MTRITSYENLNESLRQLDGTKVVVLAGGCFDILHPGHIAFLKAAKSKENTLVILLESDESVTKRKGNGRPVNIQEKRALALQKLDIIDLLVTLPPFKTDKEYYELTKRIEPGIIAVTKNDPSLNHKIKQAHQVGGKVIEVIDRLSDFSTTKIINDTNKA